MCRSIVTLRRETPATDDEVRAASLQFVRKISGYRAPYKINQEAFDAAVEDIAMASATPEAHPGRRERRERGPYHKTL